MVQTRPGNGRWTEEEVPIFPISSGPRSHFCGFHDIVPWNATNDYFLALEADESECLPDGHKQAAVGIIDLTSKPFQFTPLAQTRAWNWHVGARQQWLDDSRIIYNDLRDGSHVAVIRHIDSGSETVLDRGVWTISADGNWAIAPNLARLAKFYPVYGYAGGNAPSLSDMIPKDDGLYLIDLKSGTSRLIFSVAELVERCYSDQPTPPEGPFWLTHPTFNPDGSGFCFYLRRLLEDGYLYSDFFYADRDGHGARLLLRDLVSHFDWLDSDRLLIWTRQARVLQSMRKGALKNPLTLHLFKFARGIKRSLVGGQSWGAFKLLNVQTGETSTIGADVLVEDGHNMFSPDRAWMVCDTYADKAFNQTLYLYHMGSDRRVDIGKFPYAQRLAGTPAGCDLHPRWNRVGTQVCVDSAQGETRQIYVAVVDDIVGQAR